MFDALSPVPQAFSQFAKAIQSQCMTEQLDRIALARKQAAQPFAKPINASRTDKR
jgi:hypothetical protein